MGRPFATGKPRPNGTQPRAPQGRGATSTIPYRGSELEVCEEGEIWTVRLGELEESSPYLDFALAQLLDDGTARVHHLALN